VGIGGYGWQLCGVIRQAARDGNCALVCAADRKLHAFSDRAKELADEDVRLFADAAEMFRAMQGRCDAIYICTGIPSHLGISLAAAQAGYHVHVEKPPDATVQRADELSNIRARYARLCAVGFHDIYGLAMRTVKDRLVSGALGEIVSISAYAFLPRTALYYRRNEWAGRLRVGEHWVLDGPATNAMAHQINGMLFLAGRDAAAYATPGAVRGEMYAAGPIEGHDTAAIEIATTEGPTCRFYGTHCCEESQQPVITVQCRQGRATWAARRAVIEHADGRREEITPDLTERDEMVAAFVNAISRNDPSLILTPPGDGRKTVAVFNAAHDSSGAIRRIPADDVRHIGEGDEARTVIPGIEDVIRGSLERGCLFSELDDAPRWAVPGERIDLVGYDHFPQRFRCE
jgi:predicted dehydrogenase